MEIKAASREFSYAHLKPLIARMTGDEKHSRAAHSTLDVMWVLFDRVLRVSPGSVTDPGRDRFLLSKGHGPHAYFATLAAKGYFPAGWLDSFGRFDSRFGHHPDRLLVPGVEISSGSLGHGLPIADGLALGLRAQGHVDARVFCLVGDGELAEGSNHEAIVAAARLRLTNLTVIVVDNRSATFGWPGGVAERFAVEGWRGIDVDGRDHHALYAALSQRNLDRPLVVGAIVEDGR